MVSKGKLMVGAVLTFLAGCAIGMAIGGYQGLHIGTSAIVNDALLKDAREVEARIAILKQLRAGQTEPAIDKLETGLADILIVFDPAEPYPGLSVQTVAALRQAIESAKAYRSAYPRQKKNFRDDMVDRLFERNLYK